MLDWIAIILVLEGCTALVFSMVFVELIFIRRRVQKLEDLYRGK